MKINRINKSYFLEGLQEVCNMEPMNSNLRIYIDIRHIEYVIDILPDRNDIYIDMSNEEIYLIEQFINDGNVNYESLWSKVYKYLVEINHRVLIESALREMTDGFKQYFNAPKFNKRFKGILSNVLDSLGDLNAFIKSEIIEHDDLDMQYVRREIKNTQTAIIKTSYHISQLDYMLEANIKMFKNRWELERIKIINRKEEMNRVREGAYGN